MKKTIKINFKIKLSFNKKKIAFLLFVLVFLLALSSLPYFNIFFNLWITIIITAILGIVIFSSFSQFFLLAIFLMLFALIFSLFHEDNLAEQIGNAIYFILLIAFIKNFFGYLKEVKNKK